MKWTFSKISITYLTPKSIRAKMSVLFRKLRLNSEKASAKSKMTTNSENYKSSLDLTAFSINLSRRGKSARMRIFRI